MRHTIKNVCNIHPLKNISRRATGWQVQKRINHTMHESYFSDFEHGSAYKALMNAIHFRNKKFGDPMSELRSELQRQLNTYGRPSTYLPKFEAGKPFMIRASTLKPAVYRAARNYGYDVTINDLQVTIN